MEPSATTGQQTVGISRAAGFALLVLLYLVPVWSFPYLPTQDGPSHLSNAVILRDYGSRDTRYQEFFEIRWEPFPNWTSHLLLTALLYFVPPLVAEKVLVSLYLLGFGWSFWYFLGAFGSRGRELAPVGLLFVFNFCFLMGFYNYCLSLIFFWLALGYCLRRERVGLADCVVLGLILLATYFTHLVGFLLTAGSVVWVAVSAWWRRPRNLLWVGGAVVPSALLTADYLIKAGFFAAHGDGGGWEAARDWLRIQTGLERFWTELTAVNQGLFRPYEESFPLGTLVLFFYLGLVLTTLFAERLDPEPAKPLPRKWPVALLALALAALYFVLPDSLGAHGGYLRARLPFLPPLLLLACLRLPPQGWVRFTLRTAMYLLLGVNLALISRYFHAAQSELAEFTAGAASVGHGHTLSFVKSDLGTKLVDYLEHASDYYCLSTGNINMDNYEATKNYFPIRFRPGTATGHGDYVLVWTSPLGWPYHPPENYREVYHQRRLLIFEDRTLTEPRLRAPSSSHGTGTP
jgi:hypothetical protein